jgi:hypothetical protein
MKILEIFTWLIEALVSIGMFALLFITYFITLFLSLFIQKGDYNV